MGTPVNCEETFISEITRGELNKVNLKRERKTVDLVIFEREVYFRIVLFLH